MKTVIISLTLLLSFTVLKAQEKSGTTITVTVPVQTDKGEIIVGLYDEATFMKAAPLQGKNSKIENGKATVTFEDVTPGIYAISLFHDTNGNKQMDFEPNGMPKESYGVSNNVMNFGPPQWSDAKFEVAAEPIEMEIRM